MTDEHLRNESRRRGSKPGASTDPLLRPLPRRFYQTTLLEAAGGLLGKRLVRQEEGELTAGTIVEVEAYGGTLDPTAHSFGGPTERCRSMFLGVGHAYVYRSYGVHWCLNVVAGEREFATAILLRAVRPLHGTERMRDRRERREGPRLAEEKLARGPGNLARAFGIDRSHDAHDLCQGRDLWIAEGPTPSVVRWSERIGLGDHPSATWCWRAFVAEERCVSRPSPARATFARPRPSFAQARAQGLRASRAREDSQSSRRT